MTRGGDPGGRGGGAGALRPRHEAGERAAPDGVLRDDGVPPQGGDPAPAGPGRGRRARARGRGAPTAVRAGGGGGPGAGVGGERPAVRQAPGALPARAAAAAGAPRGTGPGGPGAGATARAERGHGRPAAWPPPAPGGRARPLYGRPPAAASLRALGPVRTWGEWAGVAPDALQADLVLHCGAATAGFHLTTLVAVDVASGWTELQAVWGLGMQRVGAALHHVRRDCPSRCASCTPTPGARSSTRRSPPGAGATGSASPAGAPTAVTTRPGWSRRTATSSGA